MVLDKILTILDSVAAFVLAAHVGLGWFSPEVVAYHAAYIILKGAIFVMNDWASRIDILIGLYMLMVTFSLGIIPLLTVLSVIWLLQKLVFTFMLPLLKIFV